MKSTENEHFSLRFQLNFAWRHVGIEGRSADIYLVFELLLV